MSRRLDRDIVKIRRDVLWKVIKHHAVDTRFRVVGMKHRLPLNKSGRRHMNGAVLLQIYFLPRAPIAIWIIDVAAAGEELYIAKAAILYAAPSREYVRIEDVALVAPFRRGCGTDLKYLAEVAGGSIDSTARRGGERGDLARTRLQQIGELVFAIDRKDMTTVSRTSDESTTLIKGQCVNKIFSGTPDSSGRTIGCDSIYL